MNHDAPRRTRARLHSLGNPCARPRRPAWTCAGPGAGCTAASPPVASATQASTLTARSTLVLVPALVRNKARQLVFTLKADDFALTDDGVPQKLTLEQDTGGEPLALVVVSGGRRRGRRRAGQVPRAGSRCSARWSGGVPHKIAVVGFDSSPVLVEDFTPDNERAAHAIQSAHRRRQRRQRSGDSGQHWLRGRPAAQAARRVPPRHSAGQREQRPRQQAAAGRRAARDQRHEYGDLQLWILQRQGRAGERFRQGPQPTQLPVRPTDA